MSSPLIIDIKFVNDHSNILDFVEKVNSLLKNGYMLNGPTKSVGTCLSQMLVKYNIPPFSEHTIVSYTVIGATKTINLEKALMDSINNGWVFYGDHEYSQNSGDSTIYTWQALVKYKKA